MAVDLGVLVLAGVGVVVALDGGVHLESVSHLSFCLLAGLIVGLAIGVLQLDFGSQCEFGAGVGP